MNVLELLAKSAEANHGRKLEAPQVKELLTIFQALQQQALNSQARLEGLTRIAVVQNQMLGDGRISESAFDEAEAYGLKIEWDDEGGGIEVTTYQVDMPELSVVDDATDDEEQPGLASVPDEGPAEEPVEGPAVDAE